MSDQEAVDDIIDEVNEDCSDVDVDVDDNEEKPLLPDNVALIISKYCAYEDDDVPWEVRANDFSSDECDEDLPTCSKLFQTDNPRAQGTERKILVPNKKLKNSNFRTSNDKEFKKPKSKEQLGLLLQTATKRKCSRGDGAGGMDVDSKFSQINLEDNCEMDRIFVSKKRLEEVNVKFGESSEESRLNKNLHNVHDASETNRTLSDLSDWTSSTNPADPSCSTDLAGPSNSTDELHLVSDLPESNADKRLVTKVLLDICNKSSYLTDSCEPMTSPVENVEQNQNVSVNPIEKCRYFKGLSENLKYFSGKRSDSLTENARCFVEDDDVVNPDIMYNIDLNEHCQQMDVLVERIVTTAHDDQARALLDECARLTPIPRIEHERETFTAKERSNFLRGIREYEYEIDRDDWNKIMVKRAAIFTAHAGFSIASEESLYVLADVAVDFVKKLAVILKRNFDIQSNSSYAAVVDPVTNSLQEIGVNGGIDELIKHYENDVYNRRDQLIEKCERMQEVVDQFVEDGGAMPTVNPYAVEREPREGTAAGDGRTEVVDATQTTADESAFANAAEVEDHAESVVYVSVEHVRRRVPTETRDFDLLKPFAGYALHEPETLAADAGRVDRKRPNAWEDGNGHVFDVRDYERPYNIQMVDRSRSSAGRSGNRGAAKIIRSVSPAIANTRGAGLCSAAFRKELISDLEDRFKRFTSSRARDDDRTSPAETDAGTVRDGGGGGGDAARNVVRTNTVPADGEHVVSTKFHVIKEETLE